MGIGEKSKGTFGMGSRTGASNTVLMVLRPSNDDI